MFYANSETILNNDRFFSPYIVESYPHQKEKSFNNYLKPVYIRKATVKLRFTVRTIGSFYYPPIGRLWEALKQNLLSCLFLHPFHNPLHKFSGKLLLIFF